MSADLRDAPELGYRTRQQVTSARRASIRNTIATATNTGKRNSDTAAPPARSPPWMPVKKDVVSAELESAVRERAEDLGLELASVGIRDVILPGDMKDLMNKVTEAKKAAEANLIARREETAAIRSQANTAKLLAESPMLMRLRELEILEKIAGRYS